MAIAAVLAIRHDTTTEQFDLMAGTHKPSGGSDTEYGVFVQTNGRVIVRNQRGRWEDRLLLVADHKSASAKVLASTYIHYLDEAGEVSRQYTSDKNEASHYWLHQRSLGDSEKRAFIYNITTRQVAEGDFNRLMTEGMTLYELIIERDEWETPTARTVSQADVLQGETVAIASGGDLPSRIQKITFTRGASSGATPKSFSRIYAAIRPTYSGDDEFVHELDPTEGTVSNGTIKAAGAYISINLGTHPSYSRRLRLLLGDISACTNTDHLRGDYTVYGEFSGVTSGSVALIQLLGDGVSSDPVYVTPDLVGSSGLAFASLGTISIPSHPIRGESIGLDDIAIDLYAQIISGSIGSLRFARLYLHSTKHTIECETKIAPGDPDGYTAVRTLPDGTITHVNWHNDNFSFGDVNPVNWVVPAGGGKLTPIFVKNGDVRGGIDVELEIIDRWSNFRV